MFALSGTLKIEDIGLDPFRRLLSRYFSSRNWRVEEGENSLVVRVGSMADLMLRGHVLFCKRVEFDLSQPTHAVYRFKPNWAFIGGTIIFCWLSALAVLGTQNSGQDLLKAVASITFLVPTYALFMVAHLKSVVLRDIKAVAHKR